MPATTPPPTAAQVAGIEARYAPPSWGGSRAGPLAEYRRAYWPDPADPDMIDGQYTRSATISSGPPGVVVVPSAKDAGFVMDGGCAVVNVRFRLSTQELTARCGGR